MLNRREFVRSSMSLGAAAVLPASGQGSPLLERETSKGGRLKPLAITMWDFSWLERRWPGAGYEDWDRILDELLERGYNAVRIDAYPHLLAQGARKTWTLKPCWSVEEWGSPALNSVQVQPALNQFIAKCRDRKIWVALSTWYREDVDNTRMTIESPQVMGAQWIKTLRSIKQAGLLDSILYVDLCNEWPGDLWAPFFKNDPPKLTWGGWYTDPSMQWMQASIEVVRGTFPELPLCYSFEVRDLSKYKGRSLGFVDLFEPHIWMVQQNGGEFYEAVGYAYERFNHGGYEKLVRDGERLYREKQKHWDRLLVEQIHAVAQLSKQYKQPLVTTECWGLVNYKDWPLLDWDWIKELCALGTETAAATGRWLAIATSNFCGPQFVGMWRDVAWHQKLTQTIRQAAFAAELHDTKLAKRLVS